MLYFRIQYIFSPLCSRHFASLHFGDPDVITFSLKKFSFSLADVPGNGFNRVLVIYTPNAMVGFPGISRIFLFSALEAINEMSTDQLMKFRPFNNSVNETSHILDLDRFSFSLVLTI